jgi:hypothetical protein
MKALGWQKFLTEQMIMHRKPIFSVAELANAARATPHALNTELGRLMSRGIIVRYAQGRYGLPTGIEPEQIVAAIDPGAYVTGFYALFRHHLVTQSPAEITCFTNRRHNRTFGRSASPWKFRFVHVQNSVYARPPEGALAPPEQALCDFIYCSVRDSVDPLNLVTFRNLCRLKRTRLKRIVGHYPPAVRKQVDCVIGPG